MEQVSKLLTVSIVLYAQRDDSMTFCGLWKYLEKYFEEVYDFLEPPQEILNYMKSNGFTISWFSMIWCKIHLAIFKGSEFWEKVGCASSVWCLFGCFLSYTPIACRMMIMFLISSLPFFLIFSIIFSNIKREKSHQNYQN